MTKRCNGCGIILQNSNALEAGYTPDIKNDLCERCFKLKNYNVLTNEGTNIDNDKILNTVNKENALVMFLVDFLNIDNEVIDIYKKIKGKKILVLTKSDIIPKNIKINTLVDNIKRVYEIKEDIIVCSCKNRFNINLLTNICISNSKVMMVGFTNAGKSSLINTLVGSDITVSKRSNTTQDFIKLNVDGITIIDAPGFITNTSRDNKLPKNIIKPITYQLKSNYYLLIGEIVLNVLGDANLTIYINNEVFVDRRRKKENIICKIVIPENSDLVLKGIGFIKFKEKTLININTNDYEIRPSIIGGRYE